jgi:hypothetical protein
MAPDLAFDQLPGESGIAAAQMVDPDRGIDQQLATLLRPPSMDGLKRSLAATQRRQPPGALASDQRPQTGMDHGRLAGDAAEPLRFLHESVIEIQSRPHAYEYA